MGKLDSSSTLRFFLVLLLLLVLGLFSLGGYLESLVLKPVLRPSISLFSWLFIAEYLELFLPPTLKLILSSF